MVTTPPPRRPGSERARDWVHLFAGSAFGLAAGLALWRISPRAGEPDVEAYRAVRDFVQSEYVREVDGGDLLDRALHGMVEELDPYSRYYDPSEVDALERETTGKYTGVGVVFAQPASAARVLFALDGSPADRAGLRPGDQLVRVGEREVAGLAPAELRAILGDPERGDLDVLVRDRHGAERSVRLGRDSLIDPTVRHARVLDPEIGLAYVSIHAFSQATVEEFDRALDELAARGMRALVIDVRGNLGGVLRSAVAIANRFLAAGRIVSHEGRTEVATYDAKPGDARWLDLPLAVLVDGESASASEVFAAALQEHRVAAVVGSPTYGKGMVQQVRLFDGGERVVKLITAYYYTPSHRNLERTVDRAWECGVLPDLVVDVSEAEARAVRDFLASYAAPAAAIEEIRAWEREAGRAFLPEPPPDLQLEGAMALFRGSRPGPYAARAGE
jgi:carboxyl-terminal processing protease